MEFYHDEIRFYSSPFIYPLEELESWLSSFFDVIGDLCRTILEMMLGLTINVMILGEVQVRMSPG